MRLCLALVALAAAACTATTEAAPLPECAPPFQGTWTLTETRQGTASKVEPCSALPTSQTITIELDGGRWTEIKADGTRATSPSAIAYGRDPKVGCFAKWTETREGVTLTRQLVAVGEKSDTTKADGLLSTVVVEASACKSEYLGGTK